MKDRMRTAARDVRATRQETERRKRRLSIAAKDAPDLAKRKEYVVLCVVWVCVEICVWEYVVCFFFVRWLLYCLKAKHTRTLAHLHMQPYLYRQVAVAEKSLATKEQTYGQLQDAVSDDFPLFGTSNIQ